MYWANGDSIGRANLDGTNANPEFISRYGSSDIGQACGVTVNQSYVYWADALHNTIGRANLDGSELNFSFITEAHDPCGVAVNESDIFWASASGDSIGRANLDGTDVLPAFMVGVHNPCGVAVDGSHIFWAEVHDGFIGRANLDGSAPAVNFIKGVQGMCGVAVNANHIFWGGFGDAIGEAGLDSSDPNPAFITGVNRPCGLAVDESHVFWTEQSVYTDGVMGSANLDGTGLRRDLVGGLRYPCGIAVDSVFVPPIVPYVSPPRQSECSLEKVKLNKSKGIASILIDAPAHASLRIETRGLRWRVLTEEAPPWRVSSWRWWVKVSPGVKGRAARRIRRQLVKTGRALINLRISCDGGKEGLLPTTTVEPFTLHLRASASSRAASSR